MKMKNAIFATLLPGLLACAWGTQTFAADGANLVETRDGKLAYRAAEDGDTIPDFSFCGYKGGGAPIPEPGAIGLLLAGGMAALVRRRKKMMRTWVAWSSPLQWGGHVRPPHMVTR